MNNNSQSIFTFRGINTNAGKELRAIAFKVQPGALDKQSTTELDVTSRYVLMNISKNREFRLNPVHFGLREGFDYSIQEVATFCQANDFDAWVSDSLDGTVFKITSSWPTPEPLGVLTEDPWDENLWTVEGVNVWTFEEDGISFNFSGGTTDNRITLSGEYTDLLNEKITVDFIVRTKTGSGAYFGWGAANAYNPKQYMYGMLPTDGTVYLFDSNWSEVQHDSTFALDAGDRLRLIIERNKNVITCKKLNVTKGTDGGTQTYINDFYSNVAGAYSNLGIPAINAIQGDIKMVAYRRESTDLKNADKLVVANSLGQGYHAGSFAQTYAAMLNAQVSAGGSETTVEILKKMPQILSLHARVVFIQILENDATLGISDWQGKMNQIIGYLEDNGAKVWLLSCVPGFSGTPTANSWLQANHLSKYIDITTNLDAGSNTLKLEYDAGDNHTNAAGNLSIYNDIIAAIS